MRVTVITPTYNRADLLRETIESVLHQDHPDIEYIVLDDGSSDDTASVLERYAGRIRTERHANIGETATVNKGFSLATGEAICVVSSDDPLLPGAVRHAVDALERNPEALAVYPDWAEIGTRSEFLRVNRLPAYDASNMLLSRSWGLGPGSFFRRRVLTIVGNRNPKLVYCGDMDFWARVAMHGKLIHIPRVLATHRVHAGSASVSGRGSAFAREWLEVWGSLLGSAHAPPEIRARRGEILRLAHEEAAAHYCGDERLSAVAFHLRGAIAHKYYLLAAFLKTFARNGLVRPLFWFAVGLQRLVSRVQPIDRAKFAGGTARFAVCTRFTPPHSSGQAVVLGRLLSGLAPDAYCLVSLPFHAGKTEEHFTDTLPGRRLLLPEEREIRPLRRFPEFWRRLNMLYRVWQRGRNIAAALRTESVDTIVGCSGDLLDLPASYVASRILGVRLAVYFFDDYTEQWWADPELKAFIGRLERFVAPRAALLFSPNEFMQEEIRRRHGRTSFVVRNPREAGNVPEPIAAFPAVLPEIRIVFTGAVYHLNYDILRSLLSAMGRLPDLRLTLHIYTAQSREQIEQEGIGGPQVEIHGHVSPAEAAQVQREADILLIPFSFREDAKGIVRTASTAKLADYLAAGRPILALCPDDSFLGWYLAKHECGLVVPSDAPEAIAAAIARIATDAPLRDRLRANALQLARGEFDPNTAQDVLTKSLGMLTLPTRLRARPPSAVAAGKLRVALISAYDLLGIQVNGFLLHKYFQEKGYDSRMLVYGKISSDASVHEIGGPMLRRLNESTIKLDRYFATNAVFPVLARSILANPAVQAADVVNLHLIHGAPFFSLLNLPRLSRHKRVLLSVHDMFLMTGHCVYSLGCERWKTGCGSCPDLDLPFALPRDTTARNWKLKRWVYERSKLDIVVGSRWEEERVRESPLLSRFPIHHVPYGIDTRVYKPGDWRAARTALGIPLDTQVIAFRSTPFSRNFKGTEYIERALAAYAPRKRTCLLTFEGLGGLDSLRGKYDFVELGWVFDQEKIAQALQAADIFLMPSIAEAWGMMAAESMACGTPVIVFEGTALPETIDAPRSGIAVPYKDSDALARAIAECLDKSAYLAQLRENGLRHIAAKHSFETYADGYLALYERLAATPAR